LLIANRALSYKVFKVVQGLRRLRRSTTVLHLRWEKYQMARLLLKWVPHRLFPAWLDLQDSRHQFQVDQEEDREEDQ